MLAGHQFAIPYSAVVISWSRQQPLHHNQLLESHTNYPQEPAIELEIAINFNAIKADVTCGKHCSAILMPMTKTGKTEWERDNILYYSWLSDEDWWMMPNKSALGAQ